MSQWQAKNYSAVVKATRNGVLKTAKDMKCKECGARARHRHHDDYSKPLEVVYFCAKCHRKRHRELGWGLPTGGRKKHYNFSKIPVGAYGIIRDRSIEEVSGMVHHFKNATSTDFKCFVWNKDIVIFRKK
jgi:DNA-directed RNA polymerase subunit RPC12/RpoP